MHRFHIDSPIDFANNACSVVLSSEESYHAAKVLRLVSGQAVELFDGENRFSGIIESISEKQVHVNITEQLPTFEPSVKIVLWQGWPKAEKFEWIVQKATELGVHEIWPVIMERSIAKVDKQERIQKKMERYNRIALEATKQCSRAHVPYIADIRKQSQAIADIKENFDSIFVAWEEENSLLFSKAIESAILKNGKLNRVLIVIGPEGGISEDEFSEFSELGAVSVSLGKRILRTETAGICAISVLLSKMNEI